MENIADSRFEFGEDSWVERNLVPIGERITPFDTKRRVLSISVVVLDVVFESNVEPIRQTNFTFFGEMVIRIAEVDDVVFVNQAGVNRARRKNVGVGEWRESRL